MGKRQVRHKTRSKIKNVWLLSMALVVGFGACYAFYRSQFPDVSGLKSHYPVVQYVNPGFPVKISIQKKQPSGWTPIQEVSKAALGAILVSEDWSFFQHPGYDANQITEAIKKDLHQGKFARGASTITQQVVKNIYLEHDKKIWRKFRELYLATRLEKALTKNRILEIYLNIAEWGEGIFGIGAAARFYFHKSPKNLTAREGAFLALLLPSPKRYGTSFRKKQLTRYAKTTLETILHKMVQAGYLSEGELLNQLGARLSFEKIVGEKTSGSDLEEALEE